MVLLSRQI